MPNWRYRLSNKSKSGASAPRIVHGNHPIALRTRIQSRTFIDGRIYHGFSIRVEVPARFRIPPLSIPPLSILDERPGVS